MPTSETRIKPNHIALNGAPALTAAYVPTDAGTIEASNRTAWDARIHSTIAIGGPRAEGPKRVPSPCVIVVVSFSRTHVARCSVFWIPLSGFALFPPRGEGVSPEAVLLHAEADSRAPVVDLGARARDPQRPHAGRDCRGDAFGSHDGHEVAHPNGVDGPGHRRACTRSGPPGSQDRLPSQPRGLGPSDEAPDAAPGRHCRSAGSRARPDADAGRRDSGHLPRICELDRRGLARATGPPRLHQAPRNRVRRGGADPLGRHVAAPRPRVRADRGVPDPRRLVEFVLLRPRRLGDRGDREEHARRELARFLFGPLLEVAAAGSAKIVFISRTIPAALSRGKPEKRPRVQILRVDGLDDEASKSLLLSKGFAGDEVAVGRAVQAAKGHPILLSFAAHTGSAVGGEMTRYLDREIWHTLTKTERTLLEAASLFRGLVPLDALVRFSSESQSAIQSLQSKNLIAPTMSSGVVMHDAIREYVRKRIPDSRRRAYHALAATYFLDGSGMRDRLEGLFHLVESGDAAAVGEVLVSTGATLLDSVPATDLQEVLKRIDVDAISPPACSVLPELRGDALRAIGHLQPALQE